MYQKTPTHNNNQGTVFSFDKPVHTAVGLYAYHLLFFGLSAIIKSLGSYAN